MRAPTLFLALLLTAAACGSFGSEDDAPSNPQPDSGMVADAGPGSDAPTPLGLEGGLGGGDGGDDGTLDPGDYCNTQTSAFCSSFESGVSPYGWSSTTLSPIALGPGNASANALRVMAASDQPPGSVSWTYDAGASSKVTVAFKLKVDSTPSSEAGDATIATIACGGSDAVSLKLKRDRSLQIQQESEKDSTTNFLVPGKWSGEIKLTRVFGGAMTLTSPAGDLNVPLASASCPAGMTVSLGLVQLSDPRVSSYDVSFDDVHIDVTATD